MSATGSNLVCCYYQLFVPDQEKKQFVWGNFWIILEPHQTLKHDKSQSTGDCLDDKIEQEQSKVNRSSETILGDSATCLRPHRDL